MHKILRTVNQNQQQNANGIWKWFRIKKRICKIVKLIFNSENKSRKNVLIFSWCILPIRMYDWLYIQSRLCWCEDQTLCGEYRINWLVFLFKINNIFFSYNRIATTWWNSSRKVPVIMYTIWIKRTAVPWLFCIWRLENRFISKKRSLHNTPHDLC